MIITQTVEVTASRRLTIGVPSKIPAGLAILTFTPAEIVFPSFKGNVSSGDAPYLRLLGCHKGISGGSVNDFLTRCREDKDLELAMEERQIQERSRNADLPS